MDKFIHVKKFLFEKIHRFQFDIRKLFIRRTENYTIFSIGKPSDQYFESVPNNWQTNCRDGDLGISYKPKPALIEANNSVKVEVWLPAPPHKVKNDDSVSISWMGFACDDCYTWTPRTMVFNGTNFDKKQILTISRVKGTEWDSTDLILNFYLYLFIYSVFKKQFVSPSLLV